jgi:hypothetical protein
MGTEERGIHSRAPSASGRAGRQGQRAPSTQIGVAPGTGAGQHRFPPQPPHGQALQKGAAVKAWQRPPMHSSSRAQPLPH